MPRPAVRFRPSIPDIPTSADYRRLLVSSSISEFGDWSARLALAAVLLTKTDDPAWVGFVTAAFIAPRLGLGQVLTSWSERLPRKPVLVGGDSLRALVFVIAGLVDVSPIGLLALVFVAATIDPVFESNAAAAAFDTLTDEDRDDGVRVRQIARMVAQVAGLGLGGVALRWVDGQTLLLVNSLTFALSAAIVARLTITEQAQREQGVVRALSDAARAIVVQPHIRAALATTTVTIFAATAAEAQVVTIAADQPAWVLPLASASLPLLTTAVIAVGSTDGTTRQVLRRGLTVTGLAALGAILMLEVGSPLAIVAAFGCVGAMFQTVVSGQVIAVRHLPTNGRASMLSLMQTVVLLGSAAGGIVSGFAMNALGIERGIEICLAIAFLAWLIPLPADDVDPAGAVAAGTVAPS